MKIESEMSLRLPNGIKMPCIGFGTWRIPDGDAARACRQGRDRCRVQLIDTAAAYGNEASVGVALRGAAYTAEVSLSRESCGIRREATIRRALHSNRPFKDSILNTLTFT